MRKSEARSPINSAAERLRSIVLDAEEGAFIGSEDALMAQLGCSRNTVRQVARLLEREGVLRVKRGINGGYFGSRPDAGTIEATVAAYLETLDMDPQDVTILASALWVEAMRKAVAANRDRVEETVERLRKRVLSIKDSATFAQVQKVELEMQSAIFELANTSYIKLIFDVNVAFSVRKFQVPVEDDETEFHHRFVPSWRDAKLMELLALGGGDREVAVMASQYSRKIWHERVWRRYRTDAQDNRAHASPQTASKAADIQSTL